MKIRMLYSLATPEWSYPRGSIHIVGIHLSEEVARTWISRDLAEEYIEPGELSNPPTGKHKVTNLYVNEEGKLVVEYENTPTP